MNVTPAPDAAARIPMTTEEMDAVAASGAADWRTVARYVMGYTVKPACARRIEKALEDFRGKVR